MADGIDLSDYVHRSQAEARENELLDSIAAYQASEDAGRARVKQLESKLRGQTYRGAFDKIADKLGISAEHRDDVYDLVKFAADKDEPDVKAMAKATRSWLEAKPARARYLDADPDGEDLDEPVGKARLHTELDADDDEDEAPVAPRAKVRGTRPAATGRFAYRSSNLSDPAWMAKNGVAYSLAQQDGTAVRVGD
jgi:hypothetical protein